MCFIKTVRADRIQVMHLRVDLGFDMALSYILDEILVPKCSGTRRLILSIIYGVEMVPDTI